MHAGDVTLGRVSENDHVNIIPLFQRPYVWNRDENWVPVWHDVTVSAMEVETARPTTERNRSDLP